MKGRGSYIAKGDQKRYQSAVDRSSALNQNIATRAIGNVNAMHPTFVQNYNNAAQRGMEDYDTIMSGYKNFQFDPNIRKGYTDLLNPTSSSRGGYEDFAKTGGLSPLDISGLRARSTSPARSIYGNATDEMRRAGIDNPAAYSRIAREKSGQIADLTASAEGNIAGMRQQGKLAGLSGLTHIDETDAALKQAGLAGLSDLDRSELAKLTQMSSLYSASPGLAGTFGNQVLSSLGLGLQGADLQRGVSNDYLQALLNKRQIPGDFTQAMGKIGSVLQLGGAIPGF